MGKMSKWIKFVLLSISMSMANGFELVVKIDRYAPFPGHCNFGVSNFNQDIKITTLKIETIFQFWTASRST